MSVLDGDILKFRPKNSVFSDITDLTSRLRLYRDKKLIFKFWIQLFTRSSNAWKFRTNESDNWDKSTIFILTPSRIQKATVILPARSSKQIITSLSSSSQARSWAPSKRDLDDVSMKRFKSSIKSVKNNEVVKWDVAIVDRDKTYNKIGHGAPMIKAADPNSSKTRVRYLKRKSSVLLLQASQYHPHWS